MVASHDIILFSASPYCVITLFLSIYCILYHSPKPMTKEYKVLLYIECSLCSFGALYVSLAVHPAHLPYCKVYSVNGLLSFLGFSNVFQLSSMLFIFCIKACFDLLLIHFRYSSLRVDPSLSGKEQLQKRVFYIVNITGGVFIPAIVLFTLKLDNVAQLRIRCLENVPGDVGPYLSDRVIYSSFKESGIHIKLLFVYFVIGSWVYISELICLVHKTRKKFAYLKSVMAPSTYQTHRSFTKILYIQVAIQAFGSILPAFAYVVTEPWKTNVSAALDLAIDGLIMANCVAPTYLYYSIRSYRKAISKVFFCFFSRKVNASSSIQAIQNLK